MNVLVPMTVTQTQIALTTLVPTPVLVEQAGPGMDSHVTLVSNIYNISALRVYRTNRPVWQSVWLKSIFSKSISRTDILK